MKFTEEKIQFAGNIEFAGSYDEGEKELIGKVWAEKLGNLFLMAWKSKAANHDIYNQINGVMND
jgi:hypothetical protein